jgi:hypothetical protein
MIHFFTAFTVFLTLSGIYAQADTYSGLKCGAKGVTDATLSDCQGLVDHDANLQYNRTCTYFATVKDFLTKQQGMSCFPPSFHANTLSLFQLTILFVLRATVSLPITAFNTNIGEVNQYSIGCVFTTEQIKPDDLRAAVIHLLGCGDKSINKVNGVVDVSDNSKVCLGNGKSW